MAKSKEFSDRMVREHRDKVATLKTQYDNRLETQKLKYSQLKLDQKTELATIQLKHDQLLLEKNDFDEKINAYKEDIKNLKKITMELDNVKVQKMKSNIQVKAQKQKSVIRYVLYFCISIILLTLLFYTVYY